MKKSFFLVLAMSVLLSDAKSGRTIAIRYDATGDPVAVSRPFDVRAAAANAEPVPPQRGSDVITIFTNATDAIPLLAKKPADFIHRDKKQITAVWYGVEERLAPITVTSESSFLDPLEIRPHPRAVTLIRAALRDLPALQVHIDSPEEIGAARMRVKQLGGTQVIAERDIDDEKSVRFERLKPAMYSVELVMPEWTATARADLTSGTDVDTTIRLRPIAITGRITQGGKPARARVALRYGANLPKTETGENGDYTLRVWTPGRYQFEVTPLEPETEASLDMLLITGDQTIDVDLPTNRFTVRVVDASTRKPIAGARLSVSSARKNGRSMRQVTTSAEGVALLPPLYPGELVLRASADGFLEGQPVGAQIGNGTPPDAHQFQIALHREDESAPLTIAMTSGAPIAGAEVIVVRDLHATYAVLWQGRTDASGTIRIPTSLRGTHVAVRHSGAAGTIRPWHAQAGAPWKLQPATEPLLVRARDGGGEPLRMAGVTAWIDGIRVSGYMLQFLAWSNDTTDGAGVWMARRLPPAPLRILIGKTTTAHDALAAQIAYPWDGPQTVTGVD